LLRIFDWERAQANGVEKLENSRVGANAEGKRENRDDGESGIEPKQAAGMLQILPESLHVASTRDSGNAE
jgi:hypothetical protein